MIWRNYEVFNKKNLTNFERFVADETAQGSSVKLLGDSWQSGVLNQLEALIEPGDMTMTVNVYRIMSPADIIKKTSGESPTIHNEEQFVGYLPKALLQWDMRLNTRRSVPASQQLVIGLCPAVRFEYDRPPSEDDRRVTDLLIYYHWFVMSPTREQLRSRYVRQIINSKSFHREGEDREAARVFNSCFRIEEPLDLNNHDHEKIAIDSAIDRQYFTAVPIRNESKWGIIGRIVIDTLAHNLNAGLDVERGESMHKRFFVVGASGQWRQNHPIMSNHPKHVRDDHTFVDYT